MSGSDRPMAERSASVSYLPAFEPGWRPASYAVLADGTLAVLMTDPSGAGHIFTATSAAKWSPGPTFMLEAAFPLLQRFSDGRWLVVDARSNDGSNAHILSPKGTTLNSFMLGDGIEHVTIDAEDRIWVGWFDEGVFGNEDWRLPGLEWPPSSNGVACFASDGALLAVPTWPAEVGIIADCYALNAACSGVWVCPYTDFPLVCFGLGERPHWWRTGLAGPKAVAIDGDRALIAGGYASEANRLVLVALGAEGNGEPTSLLGEWTLPLRRLPPAGNGWSSVWESPSLLTGCGDTLHLVDDGVWYRWRVRDLVLA